VGQFNSGTGVPSVNHAQDARATIKLTRFVRPAKLAILKRAEY